MAPRKTSPEQSALLSETLLQIAQASQPISVRGLYYRAVLAASLPFITKDSDGGKTFYKMIQARVLDLRKSGALPWEWIVDPSRSDYTIQRWSRPADYADDAPDYYYLDLWEGQLTRPLLMVEKAGQVPVFRGHASHWGVDVVACKGYGSASYLKDTAELILDWLRKGQSVQILVGADFDPSGCDWPRSAMEDISFHLRRQLDPGNQFDHESLNELLTAVGLGQLSMVRELVTRNDLDRLGPAVALRAPNPKDSRTSAWLEKQGFTAEQETCVEMDALDPREARSRLESHYRLLYQGDIHKRRELQDQHRSAITTALADLSASEELG